MLRRNSKNLATRTNSCGNKYSKNPEKSSGFVRIIAGKWRGRKLTVKNLEGLRPTTDRVKETVFNWLAPSLHQAKCLDVFAGSGSLGLEALSRNAGHVTFLELDKIAATQIKQHISMLEIDNATLYNIDSLLHLSRPLPPQQQPFELVFIDPPFRKELVNDVIHHLEHNGWLAENALVYIEAEKEFNTLEIPLNWKILKEKHAGQVSFRLYQREKT